jgi:hypothetical protein
MSTGAIVMMVLAMVILWGGLATAIVNLVRRPDADDVYDAEHLHRDL